MRNVGVGHLCSQTPAYGREDASQKNPTPRPLAYPPSSLCPYWLLKEGTKVNVEFDRARFSTVGCVPGETEMQGGKCTHKLTDECMDLVFRSWWFCLISFSAVNFWFRAAVSQNLSLHDTWGNYYMAPTHCVRLQNFQKKVKNKKSVDFLGGPVV